MRSKNNLIYDLDNMHKKSEEQLRKIKKRINGSIIGIYILLVFIGSGFFIPAIACASFKFAASSLYEGEMTFGSRWALVSMKSVISAIVLSAVFGIFDWFVPGARPVLYFNIWNLL